MSRTRYKSKDAAQRDHIENYRSDGVLKRKGTTYSHDHFRLRFILDNVPAKSKVLDVGCNGGTVSLPLMTQKQCYVKGIDIVEELVDKAKARGVFAELGEAERLVQFYDDEFDVVVCSEVLEHLFDPEPAIKEAHRVLRPGGCYVVTVPHPEGLMCAKGNLGDYHHQNFTMEAITQLFHAIYREGDVYCVSIPYTPEYCRANNIPEDQPQWLGLVAKKQEVREND